MSKYVMVSADFPEIDSSEREDIYKKLDDHKWHKFENVGRDISTTWWKSFDEKFPDSVIKRNAAKIFKECSKPYTTPLLVVHVGTSKPDEY